MPHTNRKKKSPTTTSSTSTTKKPIVVHTKRKEILDDEGWVHVIDTPRTRRSTVSKNLHTGDFEVNGVQYVTRTLDEMRDEKAYWRRGWEGDDACSALKTLLEERKGSAMGIKNVVVLGLGSLQSARREGRRASFTQLGALETILSSLGELPISAPF